MFSVSKKNQSTIKAENKKKNIYPLGKKWLLFFGFLLILYLFIDYSSYAGIKLIAYILLVLGIIIPLINLRWGLFYYLTISLLSDDTSRVLGSSEFASIHSTTLGGWTIITYLTIFMLFMAIIYFLIKKKLFMPTLLDKIIGALASLYCIAGIIGLPNLLQFPREYIQDASYIINLVIFYFIVRLVITDEEKIKKMISIVILCFAVKTIVNIFYYYLGMGMPAGENVRTLYESGRNLLGLTFFWCFLLLLYLWKGLKSKYKIVLFIFALASLFHIITFASRGNIIFTSIGIILIILFLINRPLHIQKKILMRACIIVILGISLTLLTIHTIRPGALKYTRWKIISSAQINPNTTKTYTSLSVVARIIDGINIWEHLKTNHNLVWGEGLGGWFNDKYFPFPFDISKANMFPEEHIRINKFFKPHGTQFVILLKMGLAGFIIYYLLLIIILIHGYRIFKKIKDPYWKAIVLGIIVFLPLLYFKNFISKMQIFFGITLAIMACIDCFKSRINEKYKKLKS